MVPYHHISAMSPRFDLHLFRVEEGLGNAVLLRLPDATFGVVDWGTQRNEPLDRLLELVQGSRLRFVAATHAHADHTLGIPRLLAACHAQKIPIDYFVYPASTLHKPESHLTRARHQAKDLEIQTSPVGIDEFEGPKGHRDPPWLAWGMDWEVRVLAPAMMDVAGAEIDALKREIVPGNETSLVLLCRFTAATGDPGNGRILLPGDATPATLSSALKTAERFPALTLDNQAFVVPHHGSSKNLPEWIDPLLHGLILVSAPTNSPHHPTPSILERLARRGHNPAGARLFCTSYAQACRKAYGPGVGGWLVQPGPCFGDLTVEVPPSGPAVFQSSTAQGERRRRFGYCGNVAP